jgi:hypothetical protein
MPRGGSCRLQALRHPGVSSERAAGIDKVMYIGIGAVVLILLILLVIFLMRRA